MFNYRDLTYIVLHMYQLTDTSRYGFLPSVEAASYWNHTLMYVLQHTDYFIDLLPNDG